MKEWHRGLVVLLLATSFGAWGCLPEEAPVTQSNGSDPFPPSLRPVVDLTDEGSWPRCELGDQPIEMGGTQELFQVSDALVLSNGHVVAINRSADEVLLFAPDGSLVAAAGRTGKGPGEFQDPIELIRLQLDSVAVFDWASARITIFDRELGFARTIRLSTPPPNPTGRLGYLEVERHFLVGSHVLRPFSGTDFEPQYLDVLVYDAQGELVDTTLTLPYGAMGWVDESSRRYGTPVFQARGSFATYGDILYSTDGSQPAVLSENSDRTSRVVTRWTPPARGVTPDELELHRSAELQKAGRLKQLIQQRQESVPVSSDFPATNRLRPDQEGGFWVERFPRPTHSMRTWWHFDLIGNFDCALFVPRSATVFEFSGTSSALVHLRDELDVESLSVYEIEGPIQR